MKDKKVINKWLEREKEVSKQYLDLLKKLKDLRSAEGAMQLEEIIKRLGKETEDLIKKVILSVHTQWIQWWTL